MFVSGIDTNFVIAFSVLLILLIPFSIFRGHYAIRWTVLTSGQLGSQVLSTGAGKVFEKTRLMNPTHTPIGHSVTCVPGVAICK